MRRVGVSSIGLAFGGLTPAIAMAQERRYEWAWGMHQMWWMWGACGIVMMLGMLVFWGLVIVGIVFGIRWLVRQGKSSGPDASLRHPSQAVRAGRNQHGGIRSEEA